MYGPSISAAQRSARKSSVTSSRSRGSVGGRMAAHRSLVGHRHTSRAWVASLPTSARAFRPHARGWTSDDRLPVSASGLRVPSRRSPATRRLASTAYEQVAGRVSAFLTEERTLCPRGRRARQTHGTIVQLVGLACGRDGGCSTIGGRVPGVPLPQAASSKTAVAKAISLRTVSVRCRELRAPVFNATVCPPERASTSWEVRSSAGDRAPP